MDKRKRKFKNNINYKQEENHTKYFECLFRKNCQETHIKLKKFNQNKKRKINVIKDAMKKKVKKTKINKI